MNALNAGGLFYPFENKIGVFTKELFPNKFSHFDILILFHEIGHAIESLIPEIKSKIDKNTEILSMFVENYINNILNNNDKSHTINIEYLILKNKLINEKNLKDNLDLLTIKEFYKMIIFYLKYDYFNFLNYMKAGHQYKKKSKLLKFNN